MAKNRPTDDFDSPWKDALTRYFPEFLAFYFPQAYACIDWGQPHRFLDEELAQVVRDAELGHRRVDRLVEVATRDAGPQRVYIYVEVQGQPDPGLAERLFVYHYRLYDRYRRPVAKLAVLADPNPFALVTFDRSHTVPTSPPRPWRPVFDPQMARLRPISPGNTSFSAANSITCLGPTPRARGKPGSLTEGCLYFV